MNAKNRTFSRMATVAILTGVTLFPQLGMSAPIEKEENDSISHEMVQQAQAGNEEALQYEFSELADAIDESSDPIEEAHQFLEDLIIEVKEQTGVILTLEEVCNFAKKHIEDFQIPAQKQELCLKTFELLSTKDPEKTLSLTKEIDEIIAKDTHEISYESGCHKHHKHKRHWKQIAIVSATVVGAILVSTVVPGVSAVAIQGAISIIGSAF